MREPSDPLYGGEFGEAESAVSLRGVALAIRRRRRLFLAFSLGLPLVTAVVMLLTPNKYTAGGTVLVETPDGGAALPSRLLGPIAGFPGIPGQFTSADIFLTILKSRRVSTSVAEELHLAEYYEVDGETPEEVMDNTLRRLGKRVRFASTDPVSISVNATDENPQKAADIVNAYLRNLEAADQTMAFSRASRTRLMVEGALAGTKAELDSTRHRMLSFQEQYGVFSIEKQTEGTLELLTGLQTQLLTIQAQRDALREYTNAHSPRLKWLDLQINALREQIEDLVGNLQTGHSAARVGVPEAGSEGQMVVPLTELPQLASKYTQLYIDLQVQEAKYNVLATQLEQTKIDESQSVPSFEILDWAARPYRKSGPFRTLFTLAALLGGALTGLLLVVLLDDLDRRVDPRTRAAFLDLFPAPIGNVLDRVTGPGGKGRGQHSGPNQPLT